MRTIEMLISPEQARKWLSENNTDNRPMRRIAVDGLRAAWDRGEWRLTHQGIAFDTNGVLRDGQHRLAFISELPPGAAVPMMVTFDLPDDVFGVLDRGIRRSLADDMGISQSLAAAATFIGRTYCQKPAGVTSAYLRQFVEWARPIHDDIKAFAPTSARVWSSAPVMSAAIVQIARGHDADFVKAAYRSLTLSDFDAMTPTAMALVRQQLNGKLSGARTLDLFCRCLRAFDSCAKPASRVQINDVAATAAEVRAFIETQIPGLASKKSAPREGGAKKADAGKSTPRARVSA